MKIFIRYIVDYFKSGFNVYTHLILSLFLAIAMVINYQWHPEERVYDLVLAISYKEFNSVLYLVLFYSIPFVFTGVLISLISKKNRIDRPLYKYRYWIFGFIGLFFLSLDNSYYIMDFTNNWYSDNLFISRWARSCASNLSSFVTVIVPLYIVYLSVDHFKPEWYGLKLNGAKVLPYFWLILGMVPLICIAPLLPGFLDTYPTYTDYYEYRLLGVDQWITAGLYELTYGFDFLSVELFFRGFLVIALSRFVGKDAILPMVAVYCFLHFGKPAGEAISSIFGGYILGILAYSSRNIYGGLVAHLGVAWGMELMAHLCK